MELGENQQCICSSFKARTRSLKGEGALGEIVGGEWA